MDRIETNLAVRESISSDNRTQIPRRPPGETAPLSFRQEQIWFEAQTNSKTQFHNPTVIIYRRGLLEVSVLERCLFEMVRRHEIWRTTFRQSGEQPLQIIDPTPRPVPLRVVDLRSLPGSERESKCVSLAKQDAALPFDLAEGALLRALLISFGEQEHRLYLTLHQLLCDAVTARQVLLPEIEALYEAFSCGEPSPLPEPSAQYADFAYWQRHAATAEIWSGQLDYWRKHLDGELPVTQWPSDRPRPAVESYRAQSETFELPAPLAERIKAISAASGVTVYATLLTGFVALLQRCTGQEDVVLGGSSDGRKYSEIARTAGNFENPLALRISVSGDPTFAELQKRVRTVVSEALLHDLAPFVRVVQELPQKPLAADRPLFHIGFSQLPAAQHASPGWELVANEIPNNSSKLDLAVVVDEPGSGISATVTYNQNLFDASTVQRLIVSWQTLLESASNDPQQRISGLPFISQAERRKILVDWNNTEVEFPLHRLLHEWIEARAENAPGSRALTFEGRHLTYAELNSRANQLAHYLRRAGVGPDVLVGLFLERSLEMVVGLLGILKAGGAYVPIDPEYPPERVAFMLEDADPPVLLVQGRFKSSVRKYAGHILCLDDDWQRLAGEDTSNPAPVASAANLAYMIYTSGSTGKPKGALNTHRGICNRLLWMQRQFRLTSSDAVLQKTPFSFDVSVWEFFWPLMTGARLIVAKPEGHRDPAYLAELIVAEQITVCHFVPAMLAAFLAAREAAARCRCLRYVICSGEALPFSLQEQFFRLLPGQLHNLYGPTEAAVDVTYWRCERNSKRNIVPIGRPIANTSVYVLDRELRPLPIGIPGELYIGGIQVARGYHKRPELTAERFIPDPFSSDPEARLYKTGDVCRWLEDGNIEYLGRSDFQVKIRGHRIELGEIEGVLAAHPAVAGAVVVAWKHTADETRLVAYIARLETRPLTSDPLRAWLQAKLPDYMLPSQFVFLESLPLLPNGKLNRRALPAPTPASEQPQDRWALMGAAEFQLLSIWQEVLGLSEIGLSDNFFHLGGHSLLIARLLSQVREKFGIRLSMASLFEAPTILELARLLRSRDSQQELPVIIPIQPSGTKPPFFCLGGGTVFSPLAERLGQDQPFLGIDWRAYDAAQFSAPYQLEDIAAVVAESIRSIQPEGPYYLGAWCRSGLLAYEIARQLLAQGEKVALLALIDTGNWSYFADLSWAERLQVTAQKLAFGFGNLRKAELARIPALVHDYVGRRASKVRRRFRQFFSSSPLLPNPIPVNEEQRYDVLQIAMDHYRPRPYPGSLVLFQCSHRPAGPHWRTDTSWRGLAERGIEVHELPGTHAAVFSEPSLGILADQLRRCFDKAQAGDDGAGEVLLVKTG